MKRNSLHFALAVLLVIFLASACKTLKNKNRGQKKLLSLEQVYDSVYKYQYDYTTLSAKCNVKFKNESKNISLKGNLRIHKDSIIWISLSPGLGIEAVRLKCTKDSVFLLDRINKSITRGKYDYIKKLWKIDVDYFSLQNILTNRFFIYPTVTNEKNDFSRQFSLKSDTSLINVYRKTDKAVENLLKITYTDFYISTYLINDVPNARSLKIDFEKGNFDNANRFPSKVDIASVNAGKNLQLDLNYTKVTLNSSVSFSFKVPDSYRVIEH